jgi:hypothetical protein
MNWVITRRRLPFQEFLAYVERSEREMEFDKIHHLSQFSDGRSWSDRIKCA